MRALITGGSSGIGLGIAQVLVDAGLEVMICGRQAAALDQAQVQLGVGTQVWDLQQALGLVQAVGPLTHLVHCAGNDVNAPISQWTVAHFEQTFALHGVATAILMQEWAAQAPQGGCFVGIASTLGRRGAPGKAAYAAAKAAMLSICQVGAMELAPTLRVNAVLPGIIETAMTRTPRAPGADVDAQLEALRVLHPLERLGEPQEIGQAVLYLLQAKWVTGAELGVDGGGGL
jgi:NAD(P)-dependent dehydrogenase (short-subunit alcohol dehydrogenase family)